MYKNKIRFLLILLLSCSSSVWAQRRDNEFFSKSRISVSTGTGALIGGVYLNLNNDLRLELPSGKFGFALGFNYQYNMLPHLGIGYQLDYIRFSGIVFDIKEIGRTGNTGLGHCFTLNYSLRNTVEEHYHFNFNLYYKIGALIVKLNEDSITNNGINQTLSFSDYTTGLLTGAGVGVNYIINEHVSLSFKADYNHILGSMKEFYRVDKIFSTTQYTISHYLNTTIGLTIRLSRKNKFHETDNLPFYNKNQ